MHRALPTAAELRNLQKFLRGLVFFTPCFFHHYRKQMGLVHALKHFDEISFGIIRFSRDNIFPPSRRAAIWIKKEGNNLV